MEVRKIIARWRAERRIWLSIAGSAALLLAGIAANFLASAYAAQTASNPVEDIVLSNIPAFDVDGPVVFGTLLVAAVVAFLCVSRPATAPFVLKSLGLFYLIRAVFTSLTHIAPYPTRIPIDVSELAARFFGGADMFFSSHVGAPFLLALLFWQEKMVRYFFLCSSFFFGIMVLLGHMHYSIDVASAFFISYTIWHIASWLFPKSRERFLSQT